MSIFGRIYRQLHSLILGKPTHYQKINNYLYASGKPTKEREIKPLINARLETLNEKISFKNLIKNKKKHCLIIFLTNQLRRSLNLSRAHLLS